MNDSNNRPRDSITSDTDNATQIHPSDAPSDKQEKFRRFRAYNRGIWNGPKREDKETARKQDDLHRFDAIASTLELAQSQKHRARNIFRKLPLDEFNRGSESVDDVAWAACLIVANQDCPTGSRYWPHPDATLSDDTKFASFASDELELSRGEQMSLLMRVDSRL